jgi:hypothetical protein
VPSLVCVGIVFNVFGFSIFSPVESMAKSLIPKSNPIVVFSCIFFFAFGLSLVLLIYLQNIYW